MARHHPAYEVLILTILIIPIVLIIVLIIEIFDFIYKIISQGINIIMSNPCAVFTIFMLLLQVITIPTCIMMGVVTNNELISLPKPIKHDIIHNKFTFLQQQFLYQYCMKYNVRC